MFCNIQHSSIKTFTLLNGGDHIVFALKSFQLLRYRQGKHFQSLCRGYTTNSPSNPTEHKATSYTCNLIAMHYPLSPSLQDWQALFSTHNIECHSATHSATLSHKRPGVFTLSRDSIDGWLWQYVTWKSLLKELLTWIKMSRSVIGPPWVVTWTQRKLATW